MSSDNFAYWLSIHGKANFTGKSIEDASEAELVNVLYHGDDVVALKALKELKNRFHDEMNAMEEVNFQPREKNHDYENHDWD